MKYMKVGSTTTITSCLFNLNLLDKQNRKPTKKSAMVMCLLVYALIALGLPRLLEILIPCMTHAHDVSINNDSLKVLSATIRTTFFAAALADTFLKVLLILNWVSWIISFFFSVAVAWDFFFHLALLIAIYVIVIHILVDIRPCPFSSWLWFTRCPDDKNEPTSTRLPWRIRTTTNIHPSWQWASSSSVYIYPCQCFFVSSLVFNLAINNS